MNLRDRNYFNELFFRPAPTHALCHFHKEVDVFGAIEIQDQTVLPSKAHPPYEYFDA